MTNFLINLSNHPSTNWSETQIKAASKYGEIVDLPFPSVDAAGDEVYIAALADEYLSKVLQIASGRNVTVHLMGEMTFTFALVKLLQKEGLDCIASTTEREVIELPSGKKEATFKFVKFRKYQ